MWQTIEASKPKQKALKFSRAIKSGKFTFSKEAWEALTKDGSEFINVRASDNSVYIIGNAKTGLKTGLKNTEASKPFAITLDSVYPETNRYEISYISDKEGYLVKPLPKVEKKKNA